MLQQSENYHSVSSTCFKAFLWNLLAPAGKKAHCKQRALFVPICHFFFFFCQVKMPHIGKWEHSGRWCLSNLISFETHRCVFSALLVSSRYQGMSHCGPWKFSNHANRVARSRWAEALEALLVRSAVARRYPSDKKNKTKTKAQGARLALVPGSAAEPRHQGTSGINQMLSVEKRVWNKDDAFQEVLKGIIQAFSPFFLDTHLRQNNSRALLLSSLCFFNPSPSHFFSATTTLRNAKP